MGVDRAATAAGQAAVIRTVNREIVNRESTKAREWQMVNGKWKMLSTRRARTQDLCTHTLPRHGLTYLNANLLMR